MKKKVILLSNGKLGIEFEKYEEKKYGIVLGDIIDLSDMLVEGLQNGQ